MLFGNEINTKNEDCLHHYVILEMNIFIIYKCTVQDDEWQRKIGND